MKHVAIILALLMATPVAAQVVPQVPNPVPPVPTPAAPPPPPMNVPPVPKMDAPPPPPAPRPQGRSSFNDRINNCLADGTAARLDITERASYARNCANQL